MNSTTIVCLGVVAGAYFGLVGIAARYAVSAGVLAGIYLAAMVAASIWIGLLL